MQRKVVSSLFLMACIGVPFSDPALAQDTVSWLDNYQEALSQATQTKKPIFLEFRCEA